MLNIAIPDSLESGIPNEPKNVWKQETACTRVFQSHKHIAWCSFLRFEKSQGILWKWQVYFHAMCSIHCTLNKLLWGGKAVFLDLQGTPELWYVLFDTVNCESSSHVEKAKAKKKNQCWVWHWFWRRALPREHFDEQNFNCFSGFHRELVIDHCGACRSHPLKIMHLSL